jgi:hypothetical protein
MKLLVKKKKLWIILTLILVVMMIIGGKIYRIKQINEAPTNWRLADYREIEDVKFFGEKEENVLIDIKVDKKKWPFSLPIFEEKQRKVGDEIYRLSGSPYAFNQNYFVTTEAIWGEHYKTTEKFNAKIYSIKGANVKEVKIFSVLDAVKAYNPDYTASYLYDLIEYQGKTYLDVSVGIKNKKIGSTVYVNLETEKVEELPDLEKNPERTDKSDYFFTYTNFTDRQKTLSVYYDKFNQKIKLYNSMGYDVNDIYLLKLYPELKNSLNTKKNFTIQLYENISADTIAHWLVPKNTDPYEGVVLEGKNSIDGKDHNIHSMEDFTKWFKKNEN